MSLVPTSNPDPRNPEPLPTEPVTQRRFLPRDRRARVRAARLLAMAVDAVQIVAVPLFMPAATSPVNNLLDVLTAIVLTRLVGWHIGFLPTFLVELVPMVDLFPTWTVAVFVATRGEKQAGAAPVDRQRG